MVGIPVCRAIFCFAWVIPTSRFHENENPLISFWLLDTGKNLSIYFILLWTSLIPTYPSLWQPEPFAIAYSTDNRTPLFLTAQYGQQHIPDGHGDIPSFS